MSKINLEMINQLETERRFELLSKLIVFEEFNGVVNYFEAQIEGHLLKNKPDKKTETLKRYIDTSKEMYIYSNDLWEAYTTLKQDYFLAWKMRTKLENENRELKKKIANYETTVSEKGI